MDSLILADSHCHLEGLDLTFYEGSLTRAVAVARENQVRYLLNVATRLDAFPGLISLLSQDEFIYGAIGVHPSEVVDQEPSVDDLTRLFDHPRMVAVGETGLDYHYQFVNHETQRERFRRHIQAARLVKKPLIIHTREASQDVLRILKEEKAEEVGGVLHCFTENWAVAEAALAMGFYLSFSGILTFKNAEAIRAVAKQAPFDRLLIETDSPYLAPVPQRGKSNEPAYLKYIAACLAEIRGVTLAEIAKQTTKNFQRLFLLKTSRTEAHC